MKRTRLIFPVLLLVVLLCSAASAWEKVDGIIAVVGEKVVLSSELEFQLRLIAMQTGIDLENRETIAQLRRELLQQMINDRLILIKAKQDTTIIVAEAEIDDAFNQRLTELKSQFPSDEAFNNQLAEEGLSYRELKAKLREEVSDQLYKEKLIGKLLAKISVTRDEVETFYTIYKDSLPPHPSTAKLANLVLDLSNSKQAQDSVRQYGEMILNRLREGDAFEELARAYSGDPSGGDGGDIGFFRKGELLPEYEEAALALDVGDVSGLVKSKLGYHIIKLTEKRADGFRSSHILLLEKATDADSIRIGEQVADLVARIDSGADFGALVKEHSDDERTKANQGELGWINIKELPETIQQAIAGLSTGEITDPVWIDNAIYVFKVLDRKEERKVSLDEDWDILKEYTRRQKTETVISAVVDEMKNKVYLEIRDF